MTHGAVSSVDRDQFDVEIQRLAGQRVYWEGGLRMQWFMLRMPSYYSCRQKSGSVFFRAQAFEFERRAQVLRHLGTDDFPDDPGNLCPQTGTSGTSGPVRAEQISAACSALPELDLLVLHANLAGLWDDRLALTLPADRVSLLQDTRAGGSLTYHIYDCRRFR